MNLKNTFGTYKLGEPQKYKNLAIVPIISMKGSDLEYIVLQEGLKSGEVQIHETGSVNTVMIKKKTKDDLLVIKGEYIVGGKQNREISVNGLIRQDEIDVPAHCVQHGRWSHSGDIGKFRASPNMVAASLRGSVFKAGARGDQQRETWNRISSLAYELGSHSTTQDYFEIVEAREDDVRGYVRNFSLVDGQTGAIAVIGGYSKKESFYFVDVFDQPSTLRKHYERLLSSYAVDALARNGRVNISGKIDNADRFLEAVLTTEADKSESLDLGRDYEISGLENSKTVQCSALVYNNTVVYLGAQQRNELKMRTPWEMPDLPDLIHPIQPYPTPGSPHRPRNEDIFYAVPLSGRSRIR